MPDIPPVVFLIQSFFSSEEKPEVTGGESQIQFIPPFEYSRLDANQSVSELCLYTAFQLKVEKRFTEKMNK